MTKSRIDRKRDARSDGKGAESFNYQSINLVFRASTTPSTACPTFHSAQWPSSQPHLTLHELSQTRGLVFVNDTTTNEITGCSNLFLPFRSRGLQSVHIGSPASKPALQTMLRFQNNLLCWSNWKLNWLPSQRSSLLAELACPRMQAVITTLVK